MSAYRYYEFLAVARSLDERGMSDLRSISSRAEITPTSVIDEYGFGDLKTDPVDLLERYFDVFDHVSRWNTRRLALRLPREAMTPEDTAPCCVRDEATVRETGKHVIIDLFSRPDGVETRADDRGWMPSLSGVRAALARDDMRPLYDESGFAKRLGATRKPYPEVELHPEVRPDASEERSAVMAQLPDPRMKIMLTGVICVGKTTIGAVLGRRSGCPFSTSTPKSKHISGHPSNDCVHVFRSTMNTGNSARPFSGKLPETTRTA